ncbi:MAG: trehalose-phosphatase [Oligoflexia bacterium]|nr:trehalose-phosphatase [Oligoflexia bacterium]
MKHLFTSTGLRVMESLTFTQTLYAFDFDGTLSPIAETPDAARISTKTNDLVQALSAHAPVAVVSGRSIADLKKRLLYSPQHLIGNHGLEGLSSKIESTTQAQSVCEAWKKQLGKGWNQKFDSGVFIEDKSFSLALHYRRSRNKKAAKLGLFEKIEKLDPPPRVILGKSVMNLLPAGAPHKGVALLELMMSLNLKCAFYVGDDDTDEDVFALPDPRIITVRVGKKKTSHAQYFVNRQNEVNQILKQIVKMIQKCQGK